MESKLLRHFKWMQRNATAFLSKPTVAPTETQAFVNDVLYLLDGPEQRDAQADAEFDFEALALRTKSESWHGSRVLLLPLAKAIADAVRILDLLDVYKKALWYGKFRKGYEHLDLAQQPHNTVDLSMTADALLDGRLFNTRNSSMDLLHAVFGKATESGEMLEAISDNMLGQKDGVDFVNMIEETGDSRWYDAVMTAAINAHTAGRDVTQNGTADAIDLDTVDRTVINKLRARFPDKFTEAKANERDLSTERIVLEKGAPTIDAFRATPAPSGYPLAPSTAFRKKPVVITACTFDELVQYAVANGVPLTNGMPWSFNYRGHPVTHETDDCYIIPTKEGAMRFNRGDMLITGVEGEIYPCKMSIFEATYDRADSEPIHDVLVNVTPGYRLFVSMFPQYSSGWHADQWNLCLDQSARKDWEAMCANAKLIA